MLDMGVHRYARLQQDMAEALQKAEGSAATMRAVSKALQGQLAEQHRKCGELEVALEKAALD